MRVSISLGVVTTLDVCNWASAIGFRPAYDIRTGLVVPVCVVIHFAFLYYPGGRVEIFLGEIVTAPEQWGYFFLKYFPKI